MFNHASLSPFRAWLGSVTTITCLVAALILNGSGRAEGQDGRAERAKPLFELHSSEPYQAVHIPFTLNDGAICLTANIGGKAVNCEFDTGSPTNCWAEWLHIPGCKTGFKDGLGDGSGKSAPADEYLVDTLKLGDYEVHDILGYAVKTGMETEANPNFVHQTALLSNSTFSNIVLTIDYQHKELIVRNPRYDVSRLPRGKQDMLLPFMLSPHLINHAYGELVLSGIVEGHPARMVLDTGWCADEIGIASSLLPSSPKNAPSPVREHVTKDLINGPFEMERIPCVLFSLDSHCAIPIRRPAIVLPDAGQNIWFPYGYFGYDILHYFRVTIDYPRKTILLEPYDTNFAASLATPNTVVGPGGNGDRAVIINGSTYNIPVGTTVAYGPGGSTIITPPVSKGPPITVNENGSITVGSSNCIITEGSTVTCGPGRSVTITPPIGKGPTITITITIVAGKKP